MNTRTLAIGLVVASKGLLGASLLLVLVWWAASVRLFVAGSALYGLAWLVSRGAAQTHAAVPEQLAEPF